jgi:hypothetical protein
MSDDGYKRTIENPAIPKDNGSLKMGEKRSTSSFVIDIALAQAENICFGSQITYVQSKQ